jgi:lipopolysaccharide heptosyltransferase II
MYRFKMEITKILFFKPGAIGDLLHTLPALKALKTSFPNAKITVMVSPGQGALLQATPGADRVLVFDKARIKRSVGGFIAFIAEVRRDRYDLFIDMQPSLRSRIVRWFSGARRSLVYKKQKQIKAGERILHAAENFLLTLAPLGIHGPVDRIELGVRQEDLAEINTLLGKKGFDSAEKIVALNCSVGAARPSRNWFPERFAELADRLIREQGVRVVFVGGREDRDLVAGVLSVMTEKAVSVAGELDLAATAALLKRCSCLVSSDTGPLHLATSVQTRVVGLYGSTDPRRTGPIGNHRVLQAGISCVPCNKKCCPLPLRQCMSAITVDDVLAAVKDLIQ